MRTRIILALSIMLLVLGMFAPASLAISPSEQECIDSGGEWERDGGTVSCTYSDPVGNSENSGGKSQTRDKEESSKGTLKNDPQHECEESGPGNQTKDC
jgi:hypothetical protein